MLDKLYKDQFLKMKHLAWRYVGKDYSEDIVHDAFLKMDKYKHLEIQEGASMLATIVINNCLDFLRKKTISRRYQYYEYTGTNYSVNAVEFEFPSNKMDRLLECLTKSEKKCIGLFLKEYGSKEIAKIMGVSDSTVYNTLHHAVSKIKKAHATDKQKEGQPQKKKALFDRRLNKKRAA